MRWFTFKPKTRLDWVFEISVVLKGLDAVVEIIGASFYSCFQPIRSIASL